MYYRNSDNKIVGSNYGTSVDVAAPGVDIVSTVPTSLYTNGLASYSGTSMAAPHITAAMAMLRLLYPDTTPAQLEYVLKLSTVDLGAAGYDTTYGYGLPILSNLITNMPFYDVQTSHWYYDGVFDVYKRGYMTGKGYGNYFGASENMLRNDIAVLFYRMAGSPAVTYRDIYPDVNSSHYFANAAVWAYDNGIITGMNGQLGVNYEICRQDFAVILYRFAQFKNFDVSASADISGYTDVSRVDSYARDAVEWAVGMQIMGQNTTNLNPAGYANRAEIATMISRFAQTYNM